METRSEAGKYARIMPVMVAAFLCAVALGAGAQSAVVKCIDTDGNTTYQDAPCEPGQAGRSVALPKAEDRQGSSPWEAEARDGQVVKGMPKRWVLRSKGAPAEIRQGTARDGASEIWRYAVKGGSLLVGFAGPDVAWTRDDMGPAPAASVSPPALPSAPAATSASNGSAGASGTRGAYNRRFVIPGRYCEHVFAEVGTASRQESLAIPPGAVRYFYDPDRDEPNMRTAFTCIDGKVADVERVLVR